VRLHVLGVVSRHTAMRHTQNCVRFPEAVLGQADGREREREERLTYEGKLMKPLAWASYEETAIQSDCAALSWHMANLWCALIGYARTCAICTRTRTQTRTSVY
jgi:hypothetical protein